MKSSKTQKKPGTQAKAKPVTPKKAARRSIKREKFEPTVGLHLLKPAKGSHKSRKLLGRGSSSGHGKTSTRGSKGQTSRSGRDFYLGFEGGQSPLIRRIPKRGFHSPFKKEYQVVNLRDLNKIKEQDLTLDLLKKKGLIKDVRCLVKILGDGEVKSALTVHAHAFSKSASDKILQAGGKAEIITLTENKK